VSIYKWLNPIGPLPVPLLSIHAEKCKNEKDYSSI
jgi:hypothetical protein